jgi:hypothetical protein
MNSPAVHVVGAGLAGGPREAVLHEAARQAGGGSILEATGRLAGTPAKW